ncbi:MAG: CsbD family protein [Thermomicrobiales bacterium]|nr:CsbD family protein [Thermomicrobiales bacterium]MCO5219210.1 CsbD family protein [Thermomicrobiales bacterium]MCO5225071.1 CsbD family protein [Thermomicrobiales bacterium]MCO5228123.1 CsbD family protein [Thermomicrobiales bacterium]
MSTEDRVDAALDDVKGTAKEAWGKATDDKSVEAEGKMDQLKSDVKEGVADVKDKARDLMDKLTDKDK